MCTLCARLHATRDALAPVAAACDASGDAPSAWSLQRVEEAEAGLSLRRRRASTDGTAEAAEQLAEAVARPRTSQTGLPATPLRWFAGALPPPPLRAAQQHFWRGVLRCCAFL